jgi:hypothetical protein
MFRCHFLAFHSVGLTVNYASLPASWRGLAFNRFSRDRPYPLRNGGKCAVQVCQLAGRTNRDRISPLFSAPQIALPIPQARASRNPHPVIQRVTQSPDS